MRLDNAWLGATEIAAYMAACATFVPHKSSRLAHLQCKGLPLLLEYHPWFVVTATLVKLDRTCMRNNGFVYFVPEELGIVRRRHQNQQLQPLTL